MKTILVCYEERPISQRLLERSAELAKALGARVLVTSVAPVLHVTRAGPIDPVDPPERHEAEVRNAAARLEELGVHEVETVVGLGDPAGSIVRLADERQVDMILLGAHDGGMISRILGGSPADTVAHKAHTDVLIVR